MSHGMKNTEDISILAPISPTNLQIYKKEEKEKYLLSGDDLSLSLILDYKLNLPTYATIVLLSVQDTYLGELEKCISFVYVCV